MGFIELTDTLGKPIYLRHDLIEGSSQDPEDKHTRVFVHTGFYRVTESQDEVMAKLRDIAILEGM